MHHNHLMHIRAIDNPPEGGSEDQHSSETEDQDQEQEIDYRAKYEDAIKHSREWEKRAKDNKAASEELKQLRESQMTDKQKAEARIKELEAQVQSTQAEKQRTQWRQQVSKESKVPAELLHGSTLEEMQENAKLIDAYAHPKPKGMPNQGGTPSHEPADQEQREYVRKLFGE